MSTSESRIRTHQIQFRVTPEEKHELEQMAQEDGTSLSSLVRQLAGIGE